VRRAQCVGHRAESIERWAGMGLSEKLFIKPRVNDRGF